MVQSPSLLYPTVTAESGIRPAHQPSPELPAAQFITSHTVLLPLVRLVLQVRAVLAVAVGADFIGSLFELTGESDETAHGLPQVVGGHLLFGDGDHVVGNVELHLIVQARPAWVRISVGNFTSSSAIFAMVIFISHRLIVCHALESQGLGCSRTLVGHDLLVLCSELCCS